MWVRWWSSFFLELLFTITQFRIGTGVSLFLQFFFHSSIGLLVRSYKSIIVRDYIELPSYALLGVIALTLILNIFRVRKIGLKSVFVMVCNNSWYLSLLIFSSPGQRWSGLVWGRGYNTTCAAVYSWSVVVLAAMAKAISLVLAIKV